MEEKSITAQFLAKWSTLSDEDKRRFIQLVRQTGSLGGELRAPSSVFHQN